MLITTVLILFYLLAPLLILWLCNRFTIINRIGSVLVAYALGLIIGNTGIISPEYKIVQEWVANISIPFAIPMLLFSSDVRSWLHMSRRFFMSLLLALISVVLVVVIGYIYYQDKSFPDLWKVGGMFVGVYSGGTPNLASLKVMLNVSDEAYIIVHTYDMLITSVYLLFLVAVGRYTIGKILPKYTNDSNTDSSKNDIKTSSAYWGMWRGIRFTEIIKAPLISLTIFAASFVISLLFAENNQMLVIMLLITTLSILASFNRKVRTSKMSFGLGMYLILIFCVDIASMADINQFVGATPHLLKYMSFVIFGSLFIHILLSKIFKIDGDTTMTTSVALICSPPFVPVIAGALKNSKVIIPGLTVGIIGYALGNYLGAIVAELLSVL